MPLPYHPARRIILKGNPDYDERWVRERIEQDPKLVGLGEIRVSQRERSQVSGGRLDLLLSDDARDTRFEFELQLGATDPSHIVRTIEYWDEERRKYPGYDHIAVIAAEDVTRRFLSFLGLLNGQIPLIALQVRALEVNGAMTLDFAKVLDQRALREEDEPGPEGAASATVDYWQQKSARTLGMARKTLEIINNFSQVPCELSYARDYIGLRQGNRVDNFCHFHARKNYVLWHARVEDPDAWVAVFDSFPGLEASRSQRYIRLSLSDEDFLEHGDQIRDIIKEAVRLRES